MTLSNGYIKQKKILKIINRIRALGSIIENELFGFNLAHVNVYKARCHDDSPATVRRLVCATQL